MSERTSERRGGSKRARTRARARARPVGACGGIGFFCLRRAPMRPGIEVLRGLGARASCPAHQVGRKGRSERPRACGANDESVFSEESSCSSAASSLSLRRLEHPPGGARARALPREHQKAPRNAPIAPFDRGKGGRVQGRGASKGGGASLSFRLTFPSFESRRRAKKVLKREEDGSRARLSERCGRSRERGGGGCVVRLSQVLEER